MEVETKNRDIPGGTLRWMATMWALSLLWTALSGLAVLVLTLPALVAALFLPHGWAAYLVCWLLVSLSLGDFFRFFQFQLEGVNPREAMGRSLPDSMTGGRDRSTSELMAMVFGAINIYVALIVIVAGVVSWLIGLVAPVLVVPAALLLPVAGMYLESYLIRTSNKSLVLRLVSEIVDGYLYLTSPTAADRAYYKALQDAAGVVIIAVIAGGETEIDSTISPA